MQTTALDQLLAEVPASSLTSSTSMTVEAAERSTVLEARRVTDNDWRLTLQGTRALAAGLEAVIKAAPEAAQGTCRTTGRLGRHQVQLEIGCRGPELLAGVLETVIEDHAEAHPGVRLLAMLQVDDSQRPRRIDLVVPSMPTVQTRARIDSLGLVPAQSV